MCYPTDASRLSRPNPNPVHEEPRQAKQEARRKCPHPRSGQAQVINNFKDDALVRLFNEPNNNVPTNPQRTGTPSPGGAPMHDSRGRGKSMNSTNGKGIQKPAITYVRPTSPPCQRVDKPNSREQGKRRIQQQLSKGIMADTTSNAAQRVRDHTTTSMSNMVITTVVPHFIALGNKEKSYKPSSNEPQGDHKQDSCRPCVITDDKIRITR